MPTIMIIEGVRFYFYSNEETRIHVHVECQNREAKIWLDTFEIAYNFGFRSFHLNKIIRLIKKHEKEIKRQWISFFG
jgi:hypothetical protein